MNQLNTNIKNDSCHKNLDLSAQKNMFNLITDFSIRERNDACFVNHSNFISNKKDLADKIDIDSSIKNLKTPLNKCGKIDQINVIQKPLVYCDKNVLNVINSRNKKSNNFPKTQINRFYQFPNEVSNFIDSSSSKIGINTRLIYKN